MNRMNWDRVSRNKRINPRGSDAYALTESIVHKRNERLAGQIAERAKRVQS